MSWLKFITYSISLTKKYYYYIDVQANSRHWIVFRRYSLIMMTTNLGQEQHKRNEGRQLFQ